jgi:hypothetical protein
MPATFTKIATATSTSNNASLSFTSIPNTYKNLVIYAYLRSNRASTNDPIVMRFNGVATGQSRRTDNLATGAFVNDSLTTGAWSACATDSASTAGVWGQAVIYISEYASSSSLNRTFVSYGVGEQASTSTGYLRGQNSGTLDVTVPVTSITMTPLSATYWVTNSYAVLYGLE